MNRFTCIFYLLTVLFFIRCTAPDTGTGNLLINDQEYFEMPGLNVMVYHDYYAVGQQSGVTIVQNGRRVAANGDIRLKDQRRPFPVHGERMIDEEANTISLQVGYPDSLQALHEDPRSTFPDIVMLSTVRIKAEGQSIRVSVDLEEPLAEKWENKVVFRLDLFPGEYFDKTFYMDGKPGTFPRQPNGPVSTTPEGDITVKPLAKGRELVVYPESDHDMITIRSEANELELIDSRAYSHINWFTVRSTLRSGVTENAVEWLITPEVEPGYMYDPVIQVSQVGYRSNQEKIAVVELDKRVDNPARMTLVRITPDGGTEEVKSGIPATWGQFLRYNYARFDFSDVQEPGMYQLQYDETGSHPFMIHEEIYKRHVWQPTIEYYLPVQMCHMRINELSRVWHGLCHMDDALMAPTSHVHFDGYRQGPSTLTKYEPFDPVPGLNKGGWHDAGDYDLRVESQANTVRMLAYSWELFDTDYDQTTVDQENNLVEIHVPDGKPDVLQQIEHGALTIIGAYKALGRLYRGMICPTGRQYSLLGDASVMTDNLVYDLSLDSGQHTANRSGIRDDRWVFTEENPRRELFVSACLATAYRSLAGFNNRLADDCLEAAKALWEQHSNSRQPGLIDAAVELYLSTEESKYYDFILSNKDLIVENIRSTGPAMGRIAGRIDDQDFMADIREALEEYAVEVDELVNETPYGVSYRPDVWGAGWGIQRFGVNQYFLHRGFPEIFSADPVFNSMNFVLGVHPGENNASFVSGVGANSLLVAYGVNRADWSFIPGGSASGTALIRPDLPELKIWPFIWQQTEYVMGGGAMNYVFLVLASDDLLGKE